ncbi:MAG TPA: DUF2799 domain-containing protein [Gammaproteobacteria bacterium]|jgi:hypothetical protein
MQLRKALLALAGTSVLAGCAGMSEQACLVSDWRAVGFEDGAVGRSVTNIGNYREACSKHGVTPDLDAYRAGHAEGVEIYCRPNNGFEVGHSGATYQGVCPANLESAFLANYDSGRRLFELESALQRIDSQIASNARAQESIRAELTAIAASMISDATTAEERVLLVSRSAELGSKYAELSASTDALKQERVVHEQELRRYQETLASRF